MRPLASSFALAALVLVGLGARSAWLPLVFPEDGTVVFAIADAPYHVRRAFYSFVHFPSVLWFDPYLNHPAGSAVPWPPGFDWALGGIARLFGTGEAVFERTAAWFPAVLGALTAVPVYAVGRQLAGPALGLGAAAIFAVLPVGVFPSRVGDPDHHAAVALIGAALLSLSMAFVRPEEGGRSRRLGVAAAWALAWVFMLLTWSGSLLYVALGHGLVGAALVASGRREQLVAQAAVAALTAAAVLPVVLAARPILGGPFSTITLSFTHVLALAAVGCVAGGAAFLEVRRPGAGPPARLARAAAVAALLLGAAWAVPALRAALVPAAAFVGEADSWADWALEARPLFGSPPPGSNVATISAIHAYGIFAYLLPLCAVAVWAQLRRPHAREAGFVFAAWATMLGLLAVRQIRFGADFAPAAAVACALLVAEAARLLARVVPGGAGLRVITAPLLAALLLLPVWRDVYAPRIMDEGGSSLGKNLGPTRSLVAFAREVRARTPETAGFLEPDLRPRYGVLAPAGIGHAIRWWARRPTSVDNFGPYLDRERYLAVERFYSSSDEGEAMRIAADLGARYVVTVLPYAFRSAGRMRLERRLHVEDGAARDGAPGLGQLRLRFEGPAAGAPLYPVPGAENLSPYKLFEVVEGAMLDVRAAPDSVVRAELDLVTDAGRRFRWRTGVRMGASGEAALRVPYPSASETEEAIGVRAEGPWRVRIRDWERRVHVSEADVREGHRVRVDD